MFPTVYETLQTICLFTIYAKPLFTYMYMWRSYEENYKHMKVVEGRGASSPLHILFPLFGIPLLIYSRHSSEVICEILRHPLW